VNRFNRSMEARLEKDHFALERWCSHFNRSMAISAVQIRISSAFRLAPQRQKFVFETELGLAGTQALLLAETVQRGIEQVFEERRWTVLVGIRQGGFVGRVGDAEMYQFAFTASQAVADLA
jgi:hypothetical protein